MHPSMSYTLPKIRLFAKRKISQRLFTIIPLFSFIIMSNTMTLAFTIKSTNQRQCYYSSSCRLLHYHMVPSSSSSTIIEYNDFDSNDDSTNKDALSTNIITKKDMGVLNDRLLKLQRHILVSSSNRINSSLTPIEFVEMILNTLRTPHDPYPYSGFKTLLRLSSNKWLNEMTKSIGAPPYYSTKNEDLIACALGDAILRPNNQFRILACDEFVDSEQMYKLCLGDEVVDYNDGTCFVTCQLRDEATNELLVMLGWQLITHENQKQQEQNEQNHDDDEDEVIGQGWLLDCILWQDFRDSYRPGFGREEWVRICG